MIKHILTTSYRNAVVNRSNTLITCCGLSIAISVIILIFLFVFNELTYDRFHHRSDRIYRLTTTIVTPAGDTHLAISNTAFAHILKDELPEVENLACIDIGGTYHVKHGDVVLREENVRFSTQGIFDLFSYDVLRGNPAAMLTEPQTTVLTEALALKLFGKSDPVGEVVLFDHKPYQVVGVVGDLPSNTDLKFTALLASSVDGSEELLDWDDYYVYLLVQEGVQASLQSSVNSVAARVYESILPPEYQGITIQYNPQPLTSIHFDTTYLGDTPKGNRTNVYAFSCIALLILFIACINYINLSIARAVMRNKEMLVRRVTGSSKLNITLQLISESIITALISCIGALIIAVLVMPLVNELANINLSPSLLVNPLVILIAILIVSLLGLLTGIYPVLYQIRITGHTATQSSIKSGFSQISKGLLTLQFVLSIALIAAVL